ncbi:erythromycin esterase family protein [Pseudoduganella rivuli]|nr:erythromycin esterase family protein [Pseudoduganella rivuli]
MKTKWKSQCLAALLMAALLPPAHAAAPLPGVSQWPMASLHPEHDDDRDLLPFARAIGNARVVALAEQTHGGAEEFVLKTRLLKYLHEKMGFDVLLLESGFYDMGRLAARMQRGKQLDDMAPGNVFYMYAKSAEGRAMLQYLDRQRALGKPMALAGIDSQHTGALSIAELLPDLQAFLRQHAPALATGPDWEAYRTAAQPLFTLQRTPPAPDIRAAFERHAAAIDGALCACMDATAGGAGWWCRVARSVHAQAQTYWSGDTNYQRDNAMGDNAVWLADTLFKGKKVVVWAHTIHVARGFQRTPDQLQAGEVMHRRWGADYKVVQLTAAEGEVVEFASMQPFKVPKPAPGSLEARLADSGQRWLGLTAAAPVMLPQSSFDYAEPMTGRLGKNWDVLFYVRTMTPVRMTR